MTSVRSKLPFVAMILLACVVLILSLWDIIYERQWIQGILALYGILAILTIVLLFLRTQKKSTDANAVKEFEKTLEGKLYHFKCPNCNGIFAVKKSKRNNKKPFTLTCPDCGYIGKIPPTPISIWAEGTDLFQDIQIHSCPYCGEKQSMNSI